MLALGHPTKSGGIFKGLKMQTLLGFWCIERPSVYITRSIVLCYADNGFGELVVIPRDSFPVHSINTINQ
jgi:hypothetical protein